MIAEKLNSAKEGGDAEKIDGMIKMIPKAQVRVTRDPLTLGQLDHSKLQRPQIKNISKSVPAERLPNPLMDKISIN